MKFVAHVLFGQIARLDDDLLHADPFCFTRSPSFRLSGGLRIRSSPPINPCSTRTPCPPPLRVMVAPVLTERRGARPLASTNTALPRTADDGITIDGGSSAPRD